MIQKFKCPNCFRTSEVETKDEEITILTLCGCGYEMLEEEE